MTPGDKIKVEADQKIAKELENSLGSIFDCSFGMSCSNDIDQVGKDPNVGKDLTAEEKESLGGSVSGTPNGLEPDDEDKPNSSQNTGQNNNSSQLNQTYSSIKDAPQYPQGFRATQNGTTKHTINNRELLSELRKVESGKWQKVYKNGFDASGNKVSVHYFQSQSGRVFNVKVKPNWS